jgi:ABC-type transport system substrate-binding protein
MVPPDCPFDIFSTSSSGSAKRLLIVAGLTGCESGQHVDPRRGDQLDRDPDDGRLQQSSPLKQDVAQNSLQSIIPDLATDWAWNEDGNELTFRLRQGVKWHDGHPFTASDVKCTWDLLLGKLPEKLRANPRKAWYQNLEEVTADGDFTATFRLKRPQPAIIALLASGYAPVYPCHVSPRDMRQHPIGTGPFKFVEFKPDEYIKVARNPDYWKPGWPYLDGIFVFGRKTLHGSDYMLGPSGICRVHPQLARVIVQLVDALLGDAPMELVRRVVWRINHTSV